MLTKEDNELLTRVGPGTPMGEVFRQYWLPALASTELPENDGPPLRVRMLGEDLIAFRDSNGQVGLLAANCPHRGASLFFGRNEESGIRCVYHGWKFDVTGQCVDMPSEPAESNFKARIRATAYPCREQGGLIWTYMGPLAEPPGLPEIEFSLVPDDQRYISKRLQPTNFAQALEGEIDQAHNSFLHSRLEVLEDNNPRVNIDRIRKTDTHPRFHVVDSECGVLIGAQRDAGDGMCYWRMTRFQLPMWTMTGPYGENPTRTTRGWVPMDDEHTMVYAINFHPLRPLTKKELATYRAGAGLHPGVDRYLPATSEPGGAWRMMANASNDYFLDYELQRTEKFCGIPEFWAQDAGLQEGMGPIYDRSKEHLGTTDLGIIRTRQRWLEAARALRDYGEAPPGARDPSAYRVRAAAMLLPEGADWVQSAGDNLKVIPGVNPAGV